MSEKTANEALQSKGSRRKVQAVDDTGCTHDWIAYDPDKPRRRQCSHCKSLAYTHAAMERGGVEPTLFCCAYTKVFRKDGREKRRPGCLRPASSWHGDAAYCEDHIPVPRGCGEAQELARMKTNEAERKRQDEIRHAEIAARVAARPAPVLANIRDDGNWPEVPDRDAW